MDNGFCKAVLKQLHRFHLFSERRCELTSLGFVLFILVDEQEAGALGAKRQQDALYHSWDEDEAQKERPQVVGAHDRFHSKHLKPKPKHEAPGKHLESTWKAPGTHLESIGVKIHSSVYQPAL